jgi:hypothetical protein
MLSQPKLLSFDDEFFEKGNVERALSAKQWLLTIDVDFNQSNGLFYSYLQCCCLDIHKVILFFCCCRD